LKTSLSAKKFFVHRQNFDSNDQFWHAFHSPLHRFTRI
jgi:hypothetical protein